MDMERDLQATVEGREHLHQPIEGKSPEIGITNPREVSGSECGQRCSLFHRQLAFVCRALR